MHNDDTGRRPTAIPILVLALLAGIVLTAQVPYEYFELETLVPANPNVSKASHVEDESGYRPEMPGQLRLDAHTRPPDHLTLFEVFSPPVGSYQRREVYSDVVLRTRAGAETSIEIEPRAGECQPFVPDEAPVTHTIRRKAHVSATPRMDGWIWVPGDAPDMVITRFAVRGVSEWQLYRCTDDRYAVNVNVSAPVILEYETSSPSWASSPKDAGYFGRARPGASLLSKELTARVRAITRHSSTLRSYEKTRKLSDLIRFFQKFESKALDDGALQGDALYEAILREEKGLCRHRAFLFVLIAQSWGYRARVVANEAHAFVEIYHRRRWVPVELGGRAMSMTVRSAYQAEGVRFQARVDFQQNSDREKNVSESKFYPSKEIGRDFLSSKRYRFEMDALGSVRRGAEVVIRGRLMDRRKRAVSGRDVVLSVAHLGSGRHLTLDAHTGEGGEVEVRFRLPPDWPLGESRLEWFGGRTGAAY